MSKSLPSISMRYIGACALLGHVSCMRDIPDEVRERIVMAVQDCADSFPDRLEVVKCGQGVSLEPRQS